MDCEKYFAKLQKIKNTQSTTKPIKIGKQPGTTYCLIRLYAEFQARKSENDK